MAASGPQSSGPYGSQGSTDNLLQSDGLAGRPSSTPRSVGSIGGRSSSRHQSTNGGYEEFHDGGLPCPSCKGTGKIPRDMEEHLVALIPFTDKRLKPRRTTLYVLIAVIICVITAGLIMFFMIPRSISLSMHKPYPYLNSSLAIVDEKAPSIFVSFTNSYNISNKNYFPVTITKLSVRASLNMEEVVTVDNKTRLSVPGRKTRLHNLHMNISLYGDEQAYDAEFCMLQGKYQHALIFRFEATIESSYLGHTEEDTLTTYQHVSCYPTNTSSPTIRPPPSFMPATIRPIHHR